MEYEVVMNVIEYHGMSWNVIESRVVLPHVDLEIYPGCNITKSESTL